MGTEVWRSALGTLYARWVSGAVRDHLGRPEIDEAAAHSTFGRSARAALEVSTDAVVLTAAGQFLVSRISGPNGEPGPAAPRELGYALLARALALDPTNDQARHWNDFERRIDEMRALYARVEASLSVPWTAATPDRAETLTVEDQVALLPLLVSHHYSRAEMTGYYQKDQAGRMAQMATARDFADRAIALLRVRAAQGDASAARHVDDIEMLRGATAWAFGDRDGALQSLVTTADLAVTSGEYTLEIGTYARQNLTHALLTAGEVDAVATHYERVAPFSGRDRSQHEATARALREGRMPAIYQRQLAGAVQ